MTDILWRINKNSQNLFAECLCKLSGQLYESRRGRQVPGSWKSGDRAIRDFLHRVHVRDQGLVVADGSGLSEDNRVTARIITDLLAAMDRHPYRDAFRDSLCIAGRDGTLSGRMKDLVGHVFAKTGQITGVRSLSGYIDRRDGGRLCFSIIYNRIPGSVKPYEELQDEACRLLVDYGAGASAPAAASQPAGVEGPASQGSSLQASAGI
jgi:D-alanyl-D-alanine carboxypeptidase/D-alanyl-D-alanine-endopeptidase (penicillin-binding protein 4)